MFDTAQLLYLDEVLGVSPRAYASKIDSFATPVPRIPTIVVLTPTVSPAERALLNKILESVRLADFAHVEGDELVEADHLLHFAERAAPGRAESATGIYWGFHALDRLLGDDGEVRARKREVWNLLQLFAKEHACSNS